MKYTFKKEASIGKNVVNIFFINDLNSIHKCLEQYHKQIVGNLKISSNFQCKYGEAEIVSIEINGEFKKLIFYGLKSSKKLSREKICNMGGKIATQLNSMKIVDAEIFVEEEDDFISAILEGIKLKNYSFNKYFDNKKSKHKLYLDHVIVSTDRDNAKLEELFREREVIVNSTLFARDLVSEPGNKLTPKDFVHVCENLKELGVKVTVLEKSKLEELKMNAILAVAQGSINEPYVVIMEWIGNKDLKSEPPIVFVGKGVTFDSGGINLKPSGPSIALMKYDMGGAAAVTGLLKSLAERNAKVNVIGAIGLAENMPSSNAQRPGDVITSMSGQTIEVDNTDAEGRLLLADVMWYTQEMYKPKILIDLATLTGSIVVALGDKKAGMFSNSDELSKKLHDVGEDVGEKLWRLPIEDCYDGMINSNIADISNTGKRGAGSITAAQFLHRFVKDEKCEWAHLDIAGVNWLDNGNSISPKGATGYGVRLLNEFLIKNYE
ncbi:MAG: leucyl aminopeptidase [Candidatus Midichloriaceae bacterium]|jgi:leucyl aminopeptidase